MFGTVIHSKEVDSSPRTGAQGRLDWHTPDQGIQRRTEVASGKPQKLKLFGCMCKTLEIFIAMCRNYPRLRGTQWVK